MPAIQWCGNAPKVPASGLAKNNFLLLKIRDWRLSKPPISNLQHSVPCFNGPQHCDRGHAAPQL